MKIVHNHGDLIIYPNSIKKPIKEATEAKLHILQDSGPTGNRHEVVSKSKPIYRWTKDGIEYISCANDFIIQHVGGDEEHGVQQIEKGTYEIKHEMEHDPWTQELKIVQD